MRIIILGSGVIGITSAYYLAAAGHEVSVIDRQPGPAMETSFANAGQISPGYASPWAAPGVPFKALQWMLQRHAWYAWLDHVLRFGPAVGRPHLRQTAAIAHEDFALHRYGSQSAHRFGQALDGLA